MRFRFSLSVVLVLFAVAAHARVAQFIATRDAIEWKTFRDAPVVLSGQRPDGEVVTETFAAGQNPVLRLDGLADGVYAYELHGAANLQSGTFTIAGGALAPEVPEHLILGRPLRPAVETFFTGDVSAQGGVCAGFDCTNAESYSFANIKLKANVLRMRFEDTSTLSGYSTHDWEIGAGDTSATSVEKLYVQDLTTATIPFVIEGSMPSNTLYVDSAGRVGIKTSTPAKDLHIANPLSPTIRFEQTNVPFQNWEIVANDSNFYVRDVNGEQNPFIIKPDAPYYSLVLDTTGRIGLGVSAPLYQIHHSSGARLDAGNWINASSRAIKQDIHDLDRKAAFDALRALQPVTFAYKASPADMQVGYIAEDVPELVATPDRKGLSAMDVSAVLTKVIQEQQKTIEELQARIERLERKE